MQSGELSKDVRWRVRGFPDYEVKEAHFFLVIIRSPGSTHARNRAKSQLMSTSR